MSIANFGSFLGGLAQGQQAAENQRERAAYLLMLQKRQKDADDEVQSTRQAVFENDVASGSGSTVGTGATPQSFTDVFGAGATPMPQQPQQPQPMQPGQPSQSMQQPRPAMQPGAQPMPGSGGPPPGPMPQQGPAVPLQQPPQAAPGVQAQQPPQAPQTPGDGFARAQQMLGDLQEQLKTPIAQKVMEDPRVKQDTQAYHAYIKELQDAGIKPGGQKPDLVQMKRLQLLHQQMELSMAEAGKHVTTDRQEQLKLGQQMAATYVKQEALKQTLKQREEHENRMDARADARAAGKGAGSAGVRDYDSLNETEKQLVDAYIKEKESTGKFPTGTGYNDPYKRIAEARWGAAHSNAPQDAAATVAANAADKKSMQTLTPLADRMDASLGTLHSNFQIAIDAAKKAGLGPTMPMNQVSNYLRQAGGNEAVAAFESAVRTAQGEYAKLLTNSTSAGGSSVESLKRASDSINPNMTLGQLQAVQKVLEADGKNVTGSLRKAAKDAEGRIKERNSSKAAPAGGAGVPNGGKPVTKAQLQKMVDDAKAAGHPTTIDAAAEWVVNNGGKLE